MKMSIVLLSKDTVCFEELDSSSERSKKGAALCRENSVRRENQKEKEEAPPHTDMHRRSQGRELKNRPSPKTSLGPEKKSPSKGPKKSPPQCCFSPSPRPAPPKNQKLRAETTTKRRDIKTSEGTKNRAKLRKNQNAKPPPAQPRTKRERAPAPPLTFSEEALLG